MRSLSNSEGNYHRHHHHHHHQYCPPQEEVSPPPPPDTHTQTHTRAHLTPRRHRALQAITPVDYEGVKAVSFGFAGQGSAIMRGPMVSGVVQQLLTTTEWGELDYLVVDFPPGR